MPMKPQVLRAVADQDWTRQLPIFLPNGEPNCLWQIAREAFKAQIDAAAVIQRLAPAARDECRHEYDSANTTYEAAKHAALAGHSTAPEALAIAQRKLTEAKQCAFVRARYARGGR